VIELLTRFGGPQGLAAAARRRLVAATTTCAPRSYETQLDTIVAPSVVVILRWATNWASPSRSVNDVLGAAVQRPGA